MALILTISEAFYGFGAVFVACDLGQRVTNAFNEISLKIENFNWYLFPTESKRILPIILAVSHEPVTLECFGSISLSRDIFKRVSQFSHLSQLIQQTSDQYLS